MAKSKKNKKKPKLNLTVREEQRNLKNAYRALTEESKRALLKDAAKHQPHFLSDLMKVAGLNKGFRPQTIAERRDARCRTKIDEAILRDGNERLLEFAARRFCFVLRPEFIYRLNQLARERGVSGQTEMLPQLVEELKSRIGAEEGWEFFEAATRLIPQEFLFPAGSGKEETEGGADWQRQFDELAAQCEKLSTNIMELAAAQPADTADLHQLLDDAIRTASILRDDLLKSAAEVGFAAEPWHDKSSLSEYIIGLTAHGKTSKAAELASERIEALASRLEALRVSHRVPRKQARLEDLRTTAVAELRASLTSASPPQLPTFVDPDQWLRWALGRSEGEIEMLREDLAANGLMALADFVESCEADEIDFPASGEAKPVTELPEAKQPTESHDSEPQLQGDSISAKSDPIPVTTTPAPPAHIERPYTAIATTPDETTPQPQATEPHEQVAGEVSKRAVTTDSPTRFFRTGMTLQQLADAALAAEGSMKAAALAALAWRLIYDGWRGLAYHFTRSVEKSVEWQLLPSPIARAAALAPWIQSDSGEISRLLREDFQVATDLLTIDQPSAANLPLRLLLGAAAFRPALLAPRSGASGILRAMHLGTELPELNALAKPVWEFGDRGVALNPEALAGAQSKAAWEEKRSALQKEIEQWHNFAEKAAIVTKPGAATWRKMIESDGIVGQLIQPAREGFSDPAGIKHLRDLAEEFDSDAALEAEARRVFSQVLRNRGKLVHPASRRIVRLGREAVQLARRWAVLNEAEVDGSLGFLLRHAAELRQAFERQSEKALMELRRFAVGDELTITAAAKFAVEAIENVCALLSVGDLRAERPVRYILNAGLLRFPEIELGPEWEPASEQEVPGVLTRALAADRVPEWREAFRRQTQKRNHEATGQIIELLEWQSDPIVEELHSEQEEQISLCRDALRREIRATWERLDRAVRQGLIARVDFDENHARLAEFEAAIDSTLNFHRQSVALEDMVKAIDQREVREGESVRRRMQTLPETVPDEVIRSINGALESGDIVTANDYLERAERGAPLPQAIPRSPAFLEFFGDGSAEKNGRFFSLLEEVHATAPARIASAAQNRIAICGVDFQHMPAEQADRTARAIQAWFAAKQQRRLTEDQCRAILAGLDFAVVKIRREKTWLEIETGVVDQSPVPAFGSEAAGRYRVFAGFGESMEALCEHASPKDFQRHGTFVFYFDALDEGRRRQLGRLCRERSCAFAVVDTVLFLRVLAEIGARSRLPILFACALPFSRIQPYVTTAGRMPPEIFFGRHREIEELTNPMGSCFVYGGRQLGKTALLRHIEEQFDAPGAGRIGCWFDLKHHGLHSQDDIWPEIARRLGKHGVLPESPSRQITLDTLLEHTEAWLSVDSSRRILLLLDEADTFLEFDATTGKVPFSRCLRLRGLMDATQRRFKIVFAGLHNVQRTTRVANHPLAHYGQPLCIGPLLNDARDSEDARRLIEQPLAAAGYFFESNDALVHILAQSNYYPSLIQLYCQRLLRHATANVQQFDKRTTPPYMLTLRHVEEAYNSLELQSAIAEKFRLTLDLDKRYRLIALMFAFDKDEAAKGFDVQRLRKDAVVWWERGITNTSEADFAELLEEMVGLGVLRRDMARELYFLRNPNLFPLLGSDDQIMNQLAEFASEEPEPKFAPDHFRRPLRSGDHALRSPLTVTQESELRTLQEDTVFVFAGTPAAEITRLRDGIEPIIDRNRLSLMTNLRTVEKFAEKLRDFSARAAAGSNIAFVPAEAGWDEHWLQTAVERVSRRAAEHSKIGIVFVAPPQLAWQQLEAVRKMESAGKIATHTLRPWNEPALRQWLEECLWPPNAEQRRELSNLTGNWPLLLRKAYEVGREHDWATTVAELRKIEGPNLFAEFGCEYPARRRVLEVWGQIGEIAAPKELVLLSPTTTDTFAEKIVSWAQLIGLAQRTAGAWKLDPLVARILAPLPA